MRETEFLCILHDCLKQNILRDVVSTFNIIYHSEAIGEK